MGALMIILGVLAWILGSLIFVGAKSALHEIEGLLAIGFGTIALGLGGVITAVNDLKANFKTAQVARQKAENIPDWEKNWQKSAKN